MDDRILRACLRAYPRARREQEGDVLLSLAQDLTRDGSSLVREACGLIAGGLADRVLLARSEVAGAPWHSARARLALPVSAALLAVVVTGAIGMSDGIAGVGWGWAALLAGATSALVGAAFGIRSVAFFGAAILAILFTLDAARDLGGSQARWVGNVGGASVDMLVMALPAALLLLTCARAIPVVTRRRRLHRLAWGLLPAALTVPLATTHSQSVEPTLVYCAFAITAAVAIASMVRRDAIERSAATLLVAAASVPALWIGAALLPVDTMPLLYFGLGLILTVSAVRTLVPAETAR